MTENRSPQCLFFPDIFPKRVVAQFDQRQGSSDGGAILLKAADRGLQLTEALAACLKDTRQPGKVDHESEELLGQCIFGMACGYADANDAARLAEDPVHKMLIGRDPVEGQDLASQPTICRFENAPDRKQLYRMGEALAEWIITGPGGEQMMLQLAHFDRARRPVMMDIGPVLDLEDVVGGKVCALASRAEPRDYLDTAAALGRYSLEQVIGFARRLDPGLTDRDFADAGQRLDRWGDQVFAPFGLGPPDVARLRKRFAAWPRG